MCGLRKELPEKEPSPKSEGIYTFVAVDENGKPKVIPQIIPETDLEKERYEAALRRRNN